MSGVARNVPHIAVFRRLNRIDRHVANSVYAVAAVFQHFGVGHVDLARRVDAVADVVRNMRLLRRNRRVLSRREDTVPAVLLDAAQDFAHLRRRFFENILRAGYADAQRARRNNSVSVVARDSRVRNGNFTARVYAVGAVVRDTRIHNRNRRLRRVDAVRVGSRRLRVKR